MKTSGAVNRHRKQTAELRRQVEQKAVPRRLSLLSPEHRKEAQEIMDLIYFGDLTDPTLDVAPEEMKEEQGVMEEEPKPTSRKKRP